MTPLPKMLAVALMAATDVVLLWHAIADRSWGWALFTLVPISGTVGVVLLPWERHPEGDPT